MKIQWGTCVYIPLKDLTASNTWLWAGLDIIKNTLKLPIADSSSAPRVKGRATVHRHNLKDQLCVKMSFFLRKVSASVNKRKGFWKPLFECLICCIFVTQIPVSFDYPMMKKGWKTSIAQAQKLSAQTAKKYFSSLSASFIRNDLSCARLNSCSHCSCSGCLCCCSVSCLADFGL